MGFAELEKHIRAKTSPPEVTVTFDDGHRSNLQAATRLAELGIRATVFVTPSFCIDRSDFLKPAELRALHRIADVGTHGYTHRPLTALDRRALDREIIESKIWLEDIIGAEVRYMAAPGGFINDRVTDACLSAGYHLIGNSVEWWNRVSGRDPSTINRVALPADWPIETFEAILRRDPVFHLKRRLRRAMLAMPKL
jgi:peptidoglycan/xylan/chitin deacetylase (PgdA/CDA1 family)